MFADDGDVLTLEEPEMACLSALCVELGEMYNRIFLECGAVPK